MRMGNPLNDYTWPMPLAPPPAQDGSASSLATDLVTTPIPEDAVNGSAVPAVQNRMGILNGLTSCLQWI